MKNIQLNKHVWRPINRGGDTFIKDRNEAIVMRKSIPKTGSSWAGILKILNDRPLYPISHTDRFIKAK